MSCKARHVLDLFYLLFAQGARHRKTPKHGSSPPHTHTPTHNLKKNGRHRGGKAGKNTLFLRGGAVRVHLYNTFLLRQKRMLAAGE
uniref:Putative secreted protein n=1 Tax=Anopheles darlingi TaxID=43151 RepID=A0A2M4DIK8_ANODA